MLLFSSSASLGAQQASRTWCCWRRRGHSRPLPAAAPYRPVRPRPSVGTIAVRAGGGGGGGPPVGAWGAICACLGLFRAPRRRPTAVLPLRAAPRHARRACQGGCFATPAVPAAHTWTASGAAATTTTTRPGGGPHWAHIGHLAEITARLGLPPPAWRQMARYCSVRLVYFLVLPHGTGVPFF